MFLSTAISFLRKATCATQVRPLQNIAVKGEMLIRNFHREREIYCLVIPFFTLM